MLVSLVLSTALVTENFRRPSDSPQLVGRTDGRTTVKHQLVTIGNGISAAEGETLLGGTNAI
jgi:hypothetical protein